MSKVTAIANSNIAIIKYWGKRDEKLNLPTNSSISFTMDEQLSTATTVEFDSNLTNDSVHLDKMPAGERETLRVTKFLDLVRQMANIKTKARVSSVNSFPRGVGLASSASGFAALAGAASKAAGLNLSTKELSILARLGSGSASRSVLGGCVEWKMGKKPDGSDSYAKQILNEEECANIRNIIVILETREKKVSSRDGMRETVSTSTLYKQRVKDVKDRIKLIKEALKSGNVQVAYRLIMQDSNSMHATMLDTFPPIIYLNEISKEIIEKVNQINTKYGRLVCGYTFDAGPNGNIYTTKEFAEEIAKEMKQIKGVQKLMESKIGSGIKFSDKHLF